MEKDIEILEKYLRNSAYRRKNSDFFKDGGWEVVDLEIPEALEHLLKEYKELKEKSNIENLIEELTKVNPSNLSEEGLKLFNTINEIIDRNEELGEELAQYKTIKEITEKIKNTVTDKDLEQAIKDVDNNFIAKSLIKEKIEDIEFEIEKCSEESKNYKLVLLGKRNILIELLEGR